MVIEVCIFFELVNFCFILDITADKSMGKVLIGVGGSVGPNWLLFVKICSGQHLGMNRLESSKP